MGCFHVSVQGGRQTEYALGRSGLCAGTQRHSTCARATGKNSGNQDESGGRVVFARWKALAFHQDGEGTSSDIWILPIETTDPDHPKPGKPELFVRTPGADGGPVFSPDGRWLAYYLE